MGKGRVEWHRGKTADGEVWGAKDRKTTTLSRWENNNIKYRTK